MIKKLKKEKKNSYSTIDIETDRNGDVISICIFNGKSCFHFELWIEFFNFLNKYVYKKCYQKFIAHNGGNFDYISLVKNLHDYFKDADIVMSGSTIVFIRLKINKKTVVFYDSFLVLKSSLKKLGKLFHVKQKKEINIKKIVDLYLFNRNKYIEYLEYDCIVLYECCKKFEEYLNINFFPVSISSLSMYIFKRNFLEDKKFIFSLKQEHDEFISKSYAGGRVEVFRAGIYDNVFCYDINSLYPYVMLKNDMPVGTPIKTKNLQKNKIGFYDIDFIQENTNVPPVLWEKSQEKGLEFVYRGRGVFCSVEIEKMLKIGGKIKVHDGLFFQRKTNLFAGFVKHFYKIRQENKDNALNYIAKIIMNSLYGKFAERKETEKIVCWDKNELRKNIEKNVKFKDYIDNFYIVNETREIKHRAIHLSSYITALARIELYNAIYENVDDIVYCDTDSVHLRKNSKKLNISTELGAWKLEKSGHACYIGRKQYIINNEKKFKGVRMSGNLKKARLTFEDYEKMLKGEKKEVSFQSFGKLKSVLLNRVKACELITINKQIKKANYQSNFKGR